MLIYCGLVHRLNIVKLQRIGMWVLIPPPGEKEDMRNRSLGLDSGLNQV